MTEGIHYLGVGTNDRFTLFTGMSKHRLIAVDAESVFVTHDVSVSGQREIAVKTRKVTCVPVVVHCLCVLGREYQLQHTFIPVK